MSPRLPIPADGVFPILVLDSGFLFHHVGDSPSPTPDFTNPGRVPANFTISGAFGATGSLRFMEIRPRSLEKVLHASITYHAVFAG